MKTRVLMFGWEFPPHIAGGLGTACLGLTRGLAKQGVEVLFVMPKASGDEDRVLPKLLTPVMWSLCTNTICGGILEKYQFPGGRL